MKKSSGFSLLEALAAISILGIVTAIFTSSSAQMAQHLTKVDVKSKAILAAQQTLDEMRLDLPSGMPSTLASDSPVSLTIDKTNFSIVKTYCSNSDYCPPSSSNETRHITVQVFYNNNQVYEVETVFTEFE